jgi:LEA14-like dessication related protein
MLQLKLLLAAALSLCLIGCVPKFTRPNVSVINVQLKSGNILQQTFAVKLNVQNPNDRALPVKGLHLELSSGGEQIASGVSDHAFVVPPFGESEFDMTVKANIAMVLLKLSQKADQNADSIDYEVSGAANIDLPFLSEVPFQQRGSFSLKATQQP